MSIHTFHEWLNNRSELSKCICNIADCRERGRIIWNEKSGGFIHIRFDECVMVNEDKKCDCVIFYFKANKRKPIVFIVEVKGRHYSLREIQEKIQNCINIAYYDLGNLKSQIITVPILYARQHYSMSKRAILSYKVSSHEGKLAITLLNVGDNICNALKSI